MEQSIQGDRRAVDQKTALRQQAVHIRPEASRQLQKADLHSFTRIAGCRRCLDLDNLTGVIYHREVSEGSANVDSQSVRHAGPQSLIETTIRTGLTVAEAVCLRTPFGACFRS